MRLAALAAAVGAALALAAPAQAQLAPPPTVLDFETLQPGPLDSEAYATAGVTITAPEGEFGCGEGSEFAAVAEPQDCADVAQPGHSSERSLRIVDGASLEVRFAAKQATVSMWAATNFGEITLEAWPGEPGVGEPLGRTVVSGAGTFGRAAVFETAQGSAEIGSLSVYSASGSCVPCGTLTVDDISFSPVPSSDTEIISGPAAVSRTGDATFFFIGNQFTSRFDCALDGATIPCRAPLALSGLAPGAHTLTVGMRDRFGTPDRTPAVWAWTIDPIVTPAPAPDRDKDGVSDASDNCPEAGNPSQADEDGDGVGNACETAPSGATTPVTGETVVAEVISGEVFIKLPESRSRRLLQQAPISGFVPLKGVAALPVGTIVDTRKGRLAMQSTVDGRRIGAGGERQSVTLAAGIFRIRQQKVAPGSRTKIPTDLMLQSAPGAESACVSRAASGPIKGRGRNTVRGLTATTQKGLFRIVGAAGISTAKDATWATQDRCDGTRTDVGKGRVSVLDRATRKTITVRAGRSYLVKAKLFSARQKSSSR